MIFAHATHILFAEVFLVLWNPGSFKDFWFRILNQAINPLHNRHAFRSKSWISKSQLGENKSETSEIERWRLYIYLAWTVDLYGFHVAKYTMDPMDPSWNIYLEAKWSRLFWLEFFHLVLEGVFWLIVRGFLWHIDVFRNLHMEMMVEGLFRTNGPFFFRKTFTGQVILFLAPHLGWSWRYGIFGT